jgi:plastocyanin
MFGLILLVLIIGYSNYAYAESDNLEVKVLKGSSNQDMQIKSFYPEILPIAPNDSITWVNDDSVAHSITSGMPEHPDYSGKFFKTGNISPSKSATVKITDKSSFAYYYFCEVHPWITGKLVVITAPEAQPETDNPIVTNKPSYNAGQDVSISGQVHKDFAGTPYQIIVYKNSDTLVDTIDGKFSDDASYTQTIKTADMAASEYTLKVVYGLPTQVGITTFELDQKQAPAIPTWIKNGAKWWSSGEISDTEFIDAVEYLAKENIIVIQKTQSLEHVQSIPGWLKTNASWWADGLISDADFVKGLEYLANVGIIQIGSV